MMRFLLLASALSLSSLCLSAQGAVSLDSLIEEIRFHADIMINTEKSDHRIRAEKGLITDFELFLNTEGSFDHPLDSIPWIYVLDGRDFRLVSWQLRVTEEKYTYTAFLQWQDRHIYFKDSRPFINGAAYTTFTPATWYGAVYYDMIPFEREKQTHYLLLGYNAENSVMNTKVVDILDLTGSDPVLGLPVFIGAGETQSRVLIHYADIAPARVHFDDKLNGIVYDHVSALPGVGPNGESLPVPDGSLDAWILKKGEWVYEAEVYDVHRKDPLMSKERKNKTEDKDILGRPRKN